MYYPILVHDYLRQSAKLYPDKKAIFCGDRWISYKELDVLSDRLSAMLRLFGIVREDRVIIFLDNSIESVISFYGILKSDAVFVMLNSSIKARKLEYILRDADARIMISHTTKADVITEAVKNLESDIRIIWQGNTKNIPNPLLACSESWGEIFSTGSSAHDNRQKERNHTKNVDLDLAALIYTSGTTGEPKGVIASHYNMTSAARSIIQYLENTHDDVILNVLPLSFGYGLYQIITAVMCGASVVIEKNFVYLHRVLSRISDMRITGFPFVPTILGMMLKLQEIEKYDFSSLRYVTNAGAALPASYIRRFRAFFPKIKFYSMYGLTECVRVSYLEPEMIDALPKSAGKAMPNCEVFLINGNGEEAGTDEIGELIVRGSNVMKGYWKAPEMSAKIFRQGRYPGEIFLHTGDFFKKDQEGYLFFIGRKDDLIKCRGERLSPREIEDIICEVDGVVESAVVGIQDEVAGQTIKAYVVCNNIRPINETAILKHCKQNLEPFAVPKYIEFIDSLPKTDNGKINRRMLDYSVSIDSDNLKKRPQQASPILST